MLLFITKSHRILLIVLEGMARNEFFIYIHDRNSFYLTTLSVLDFFCLRLPIFVIVIFDAPIYFERVNINTCFCISVLFG